MPVAELDASHDTTGEIPATGVCCRRWGECSTLKLQHCATGPHAPRTYSQLACIHSVLDTSLLQSSCSPSVSGAFLTGPGDAPRAYDATPPVRLRCRSDRVAASCCRKLPSHSRSSFAGTLLLVIVSMNSWHFRATRVSRVCTQGDASAIQRDTCFFINGFRNVVNKYRGI